MTRPWLRTKRFIVHNILHADDTPHSIAMGVSIALFIAILPLIGIQMILSVAIAALLRANKAVCVPVVWVSNPFTMVPLYGGCLAVGRALMGSKEDANISAILDSVTHKTAEASWLELEFWSQLFSNLANMGLDLWVGCFVVGLPVALIAYPAVRWLVISHREKQRRRVLRRQLYRAQLSTQRPASKAS